MNDSVLPIVVFLLFFICAVGCPIAVVFTLTSGHRRRMAGLMDQREEAVKTEAAALGRWRDNLTKWDVSLQAALDKCGDEQDKCQRLLDDWKAQLDDWKAQLDERDRLFVQLRGDGSTAERIRP